MRIKSEEDISTKCASKSQKARISAAHVNKRRPSRYKRAPAAWKAKTVSIIGRVAGRDRHASLLKRGIRVKHGFFELIYLLEQTKIPCLAFAVPKSVGTAVERNKIRRQFREAFRKIVTENPEMVPIGNYLVKIHSKKVGLLNPKITLQKTLNELQQKIDN